MEDNNAQPLDEDFQVIELDEFKEIPFVNRMLSFHLFFLFIMIVSIARVTINMMIFKASVKDANGMLFLTYESYAIMTELATCLILYIYYLSVTNRSQNQVNQKMLRTTTAAAQVTE